MTGAESGRLSAVKQSVEQFTHHMEYLVLNRSDNLLGFSATIQRPRRVLRLASAVRYHDTNRLSPSSREVLGRYPNSRADFEMSAHVRGTSPGCGSFCLR